MRPAVVVDFGAPDSDNPSRSSSEFEEIQYPSNHWGTSRAEGELPLHYMSEDKARRRVVRSGEGAGIYDAPEKLPYQGYDDEGKDVYNKPRPIQNRIGSGRLPQHPAPPATSIVRSYNP